MKPTPERVLDFVQRVVLGRVADAKGLLGGCWDKKGFGVVETNWNDRMAFPSPFPHPTLRASSRTSIALMLSWTTMRLKERWPERGEPSKIFISRKPPRSSDVRSSTKRPSPSSSLSTTDFKSLVDTSG